MIRELSHALRAAFLFTLAFGGVMIAVLGFCGAVGCLIG